MKLRHILLGMAFMAMTAVASAADKCIIPMTIIMGDELPTATATLLEGKIRQALTADGMEGGADYSKFCVVTKVSETEKEILRGMRAQVTVELSIEVAIGNKETGDKFAATALTVSGAGRNETKAYTAAIKALNPNDTELQRIMDKGRKKIDEYYNTQLTALLRQAQGKAVQRDYEGALALLGTIPTCVKDYSKVAKNMVSIWQDYVNLDCGKTLMAARSVWSATLNEEGAVLAASYIAAIDPKSNCMDDALVLLDEIKTKLGADSEFVRNYMVDRQLNKENYERAYLEAMRDISVKMAENQPTPVVNENWIVNSQ
ncbi:MAG: hypothetical protein K2M76_02885 [Muribaculaceae bacterium]|nr:hypothetical protein [Muribaculaceae bacterium]